MKHYIAMTGLHGYLPNSCYAHENYENAVEELVQIHELGKNRARQLKKNGYLELNIRRDGNEYCEIEECNCDNLEIHND